MLDSSVVLGELEEVQKRLGSIPLWNGGAEAGKRAEADQDGFGTARSGCILLSSDVVAFELLTGTSRICHVAPGAYQPLMGHPRGQQGCLSTTGQPGAALLRVCALWQFKMLACGV